MHLIKKLVGELMGTAVKNIRESDDGIPAEELAEREKKIIQFVEEYCEKKFKEYRNE